MNSSFSMLSGSLLEIVSEILDILELLHTVSIEFTVLRENSSILGLDIRIQYLLAEQKGDPLHYPDPKPIKKKV